MVQLSRQQTESMVQRYTNRRMPLEEVLRTSYENKKNLPGEVNTEKFLGGVVSLVNDGKADLYRNNNAVMLVYKNQSTKTTAVFDMFSVEEAPEAAALDFFMFMIKLAQLGYKKAKTYTNGPENKRFQEEMLSSFSALEPADNTEYGEYMIVVDLAKFKGN